MKHRPFNVSIKINPEYWHELYDLQLSAILIQWPDLATLKQTETKDNVMFN